VSSQHIEYVFANEYQSKILAISSSTAADLVGRSKVMDTNSTLLGNMGKNMNHDCNTKAKWSSGLAF
jgi:hypothetical protein